MSAAFTQLMHLRCSSMSLDFLCILFYPTGSPLICLPCAISAMSSTESSKPEKVVRNKEITRSRSPCVCKKAATANNRAKGGEPTHRADFRTLCPSHVVLAQHIQGNRCNLTWHPPFLRVLNPCFCLDLPRYRV